MLKKIISGGQTGVERAALDAAIELGIPHGGWIPKGRLAEDGPLPEKYRIQEKPAVGSPVRSEKNVTDSDGTLIISHGMLVGDPAAARKMAMKHAKPWYHADLNKLPTLQAAAIIKDWITENGIEILNVTGPCASNDPEIYGPVTIIIELVITLKTARQNRPKHAAGNRKSDTTEKPVQPGTVDEAVEYLIGKLSLKDKSSMARIPEDDLANLHFPFGLYVRNRLFYPRNDQLLESCRREAMDKYLHWDQAPAVIVKKLWKRLRKTHRLRIVE